MRKYLAFDIEIYNDIPKDATDWRMRTPLGISCIGSIVNARHTRYGNMCDPVAWRSIDPLHKQSSSDVIAGTKVAWHASSSTNERLSSGKAMSKQEVAQFVYYLQYMKKEGFTILTWNGLGFDFPILAEESGLHEECKELAVDHIDLMFHIFCALGHYLGLNTAAKGQGLEGKTEGMDGAKVPAMWRNGTAEDRLKVLEYVKQDVVTTLQVAEVCGTKGSLRWISRSKRVNHFDFENWLTVREAVKLPMPDTSWMTDPPTRMKFTTWIEEYLT